MKSGGNRSRRKPQSPGQKRAAERKLRNAESGLDPLTRTVLQMSGLEERRQNAGPPPSIIAENRVQEWGRERKYARGW